MWKVGLRSLLSWTLFRQRYEVLPSFTRTASVQFQECSDKSNKSVFNSDIVDSRSYTLLVVDSAVGTVTTDDREIKADSHIACRSHAAPMPFPYHAVPLRV